MSLFSSKGHRKVFFFAVGIAALTFGARRLAGDPEAFTAFVRGIVDLSGLAVAGNAVEHTAGALLARAAAKAAAKQAPAP